MSFTTVHIDWRLLSMKRQAIFLFLTLTLAISVLTGCINDPAYKGIYTSDQQIIKQADSWSYGSSVGPITAEGTTLSYKDFSGMDTFWRLEVSENSTLTIDYSSVVNGGQFKLVLITPDNTVSTVFEQGQDSKTLNLPAGKSRIKIVGLKASGELNVSLQPGPSVTITPPPK